ncbi:MAG: hypothetical protein FJY16_05335 [Bacteroidetes bacterium]|nr:hypothetical protein [Bacteroidota bacterium]
MQTDPLIDIYFRQLRIWNEELTVLRKIVWTNGLTEVCKWKHPCYTWQDKNILMLGSFKQHCSIMFFRGAALSALVVMIVPVDCLSECLSAMDHINQ